MAAKSDVKRVVLAYSGGLDTSIMLKWLQEHLWLRGRHLHRRSRPGRGARAGAQEGEMLGIKDEHIRIDDLREEFVRDFVFPMFRANAQYEGHYLLGTSIARPLIAKRIRSRSRGRSAPTRCAHGATGKGNDQVRFELTAITRSSPTSR
jgi:argininosuccinate synthase